LENLGSQPPAAQDHTGEVNKYQHNDAGGENEEIRPHDTDLVSNHRNNPLSLPGEMQTLTLTFKAQL
jgi:hypothetical protein